MYQWFTPYALGLERPWGILYLHIDAYICYLWCFGVIIWCFFLRIMALPIYEESVFTLMTWGKEVELLTELYCTILYFCHILLMMFGSTTHVVIYWWYWRNFCYTIICYMLRIFIMLSMLMLSYFYVPDSYIVHGGCWWQSWSYYLIVEVIFLVISVIYVSCCKFHVKNHVLNHSKIQSCMDHLDELLLCW